MPWRKYTRLWMLAGIQRLSAAQLSAIAVDPNPALREHLALWVAAALETRLHKQFLDTSALIKLAADPAIRVRLQAAIALGNRSGEQPALLALARIAAKDADDPWMRLAILSGLAESSLAFLPLCDEIPAAIGRWELQSHAAAIIGVRGRKARTRLAAGNCSLDARQPATSAAGHQSLVDSLAMMEGLAQGLERPAPLSHSRLDATT